MSELTHSDTFFVKMCNLTRCPGLKRDSRQTIFRRFILLCVINKGHLDALSTAGFSPLANACERRKHKYSGALSIMFKNAFANLQKVGKSLMLPVSV
ncbi:MAG: hypothetical protein AB7E14_21685, partial [Citrobacter sp.]